MDQVIRKICTRCKEEKNIDSFGKYKKYYRSWCKHCDNEYHKLNYEKDIENHRLRNLKYSRNKGKEKRKENILKNREQYLWYSAKIRSNKNNIPFNIDVSDVIIPEKCPLLDISLDTDKLLKNSPTAPSLDKINPVLGYIKGNVRVISLKANTCKNNLSPELCKIFATNLLNYFS